MKTLVRLLANLLRQIANQMELLGILYSKERRYKTNLSFFKRVRAWRMGYLSDTYVQYFGNGEKNVNRYISDYDRWKRAPRLNERYGIVLTDKMMFNDYFQKFEHIIPKIFFEVSKGRLIDFSKEPDNVLPIDKLWTILADVKLMILKPKLGYGGLSITKLSYVDPTHIGMGDKTIPKTEFETIIKGLDDYYISQFITQKGYANKIYPHSSNTIRILTIFDVDQNKAWIAAASHRFGVLGTGVVDNWNSGGASASVDIHTGKLGFVAVNPKGGSLQFSEVHPDTKVQMKGVSIENWDKIREGILEMARFCHFCPFIGWDILPCGDTFYVLEGNDSPDVHTIQIHAPILDFAPNRAFFAKNGIKKE